MTTPDPGGNFASDAHRRVMGSLPDPDQTALTPEELLEGKVSTDDFLNPTADELAEILADLEADGDVRKMKNGGYKATKTGYDALTGLPAEVGGRKHD
jgi:hypothetical protein